MGKIRSKIKLILADKDERNLFINIALAFLVKGASLIVSLFSMPLYIKYFDNNSVLGLWYTILSLLSWISICDLGLGNGLRNRLAEALALDDLQLAKKYISSTYIIVFSILMPILIVGIIFLQFLDINKFFNISIDVISRNTLQTTITILFIGVVINFLLKIINNILYAMQRASVNNIVSLICGVLPLFYIAFFCGIDVESNLIRLSIVHVFSMNIPLLILTVILFSGKTLKHCVPSFKHFEMQTAKKMLGFGLTFFFAQLFFMLLMSTNEILITRFYSSEDVVNYSVYYRICSMIGSLFMLALTPIWSKVTKDLAQKKYKKIQKTNRILYLLATMAIVVQFAIVPILQWIFDVWLRDESIKVSYNIALVFAAFGGLYILNIVLTTVANGMGELRSQNIFYGLGAALKIPCIWIFKIGIGVWWSIVIYNCVVLLAFSVYQVFWINKKIKKLIELEDEL